MSYNLTKIIESYMVSNTSIVLLVNHFLSLAKQI